jgi:hypothetical protein
MRSNFVNKMTLQRTSKVHDTILFTADDLYICHCKAHISYSLRLGPWYSWNGCERGVQQNVEFWHDMLQCLLHASMYNYNNLTRFRHQHWCELYLPFAVQTVRTAEATL